MFCYYQHFDLHYPSPPPKKTLDVVKQVLYAESNLVRNILRYYQYSCCRRRSFLFSGTSSTARSPSPAKVQMYAALREKVFVDCGRQGTIIGVPIVPCNPVACEVLKWNSAVQILLCLPRRCSALGFDTGICQRVIQMMIRGV